MPNCTSRFKVSIALTIGLILVIGCGQGESVTPTMVATSAPAVSTTPIPATHTAVLPTATNTPARVPATHTAVSPTTTDTPAQAVISVDTIDQVERLQTLDHGGKVNGLSFSPDGALLASSGSDRTVKLWSVESGQAVQTFDDVSSINVCLVCSRSTPLA
jgi:mRNA-degrading endonuclease toxin of MazEF toxin-antitoxin module